MDNSIAVVDETLKALRKVAPKSRAAVKAARGPRATPVMKQSRAPGIAAFRVTASDTPNTPAQRVVDGMKADNLKASVQNLQDMATAVGPIIDKFDAILVSYRDISRWAESLNTIM